MAEKEIDAAQVIEKKRLTTAMRKVFGSEEGLVVLHYLMIQCGFLVPSVTLNAQTHEMLIENTIYNDARRNLYLQLRKYLIPKILIPVEIEGLAQNKKPIIKRKAAQ